MGENKILEEHPWPTLLNVVENDSTIIKGNCVSCKYATSSNTNDQLGDGQFSVVKECINISTKQKFAMKLIDKKLIVDKVRLIQREVGILRVLRRKVIDIELDLIKKFNITIDEEAQYLFKGHHHVLQLFDFFETNHNIVLITQLCDKGDLYDFIISNGKLDLSYTVKPYTACILSGLKFLHDNGIVHRDIKAENILFRVNNTSSNSGTTTNNNINNSSKNNEKPHLEYNLKSHDLIIADFGLATKIEGNGSSNNNNNNNNNNGDLKEFVGTLSYISPEIVACKDSKNLDFKELNELQPYGYKVDIWALGVLSYFMNYGYMPFDCETDQESLDCIKDGDYYLEEADIEGEDADKDVVMSEQKSKDKVDFLDFLTKCFIVNQHQRPGSSELLSHSFVKDFFHDEEVKRSLSSSSLFLSSSALNTPFDSLKRAKSATSLHLRKIPSRTASSSSISSLNKNTQGLSSINSTESKSATTKTMTKTKNSSSKNILNSHMNSTFKLEPQIAEAHLMVGTYCETPSTYSNFTTSPNISKENSLNKLTTLTTRTSSSTLNNTSGYSNTLNPYFIPTAGTSNSSMSSLSYCDTSVPRYTVPTFIDRNETNTTTTISASSTESTVVSTQGNTNTKNNDPSAKQPVFFF